jgi:UDPglucose 6-dehydrogenase
MGALERSSGRKTGADLGIGMNPEFLREGTAVADFMDSDRIVVGANDEASGTTIAKMYETFACPIQRVSIRNAEFTKYASNALLATLISFSNELAAMCEATPGADVETVMDGLHLDRRLSPVVEGKRIRPGILSYLRPSSGYGGSCLPKDIAALRAYATSIGVDVPLLTAVERVNNNRTNAVLDIAERRLGSFRGQNVCVLGLAFKSGTDDLRHSPAMHLVEQLHSRGANLTVYDPVATDLARPILGERVKYARKALEASAGTDLAVFGTSWPEWNSLDWGAMKKAMRKPVVFDARNSLKGIKVPRDFQMIQIGAGV